MNIIIDLVILVVTLSAIAIGVFRSMRRGLFSTLLHLAGVSIAAILSGILTGLIVHPLNALFSGVLLKIMPDEVVKLVAENATFSAIFDQLAGALLAPFIFVIIFFLFKIVFDIVIFSVVRGEKSKILSFPGDKAVAAVIGLIITIAALWIFLMPAVGMIRTGGQVITWLDGKYEETQAVVEIAPEVKSVSNAAVLNARGSIGTGLAAIMYSSDVETGASFDLAGFLRYLGTMERSFMVRIYDSYLQSGKLFDSLVSIEVDGKRMSLPKQVKPITSMVDSVMKLANIGKSGSDESAGGITKQDLSDTFRSLAKDIAEADLVASVLSDEMKTAAAKWKNGETYLGTKLIDGQSKTDDLMMGLIDCIEGADQKGISDILTFAADVTDLIPDSVLNGSGSKDPKELMPEGYSEEDLPSWFKPENYPNGLKEEYLPEGCSLSEFPEGFVDDFNRLILKNKQDENKSLLAEFDMKAAVKVVNTSLENETMLPFSEAAIKWVLTRLAESVNSDASEEISRITLDNADKKDIKELEDMMDRMVEKVLSIQDKLIEGTALTREEEDVFLDAMEELKTNGIVGEAITKIHGDALKNREQKQAEPLPETEG
ncbi:MAG: CvpA family protein [Clostridia bacterium]|nr:CvpA family protein [Clostridia bacterium]